jgi:predicted outer membrane lipoprotein
MSKSAIQKQVSLPVSKAIEIAYKNIRMRLSRSMLVTSGIVLAIAFLLAIQVSDRIADGMRGWITSRQESAEFKELKVKNAQMLDQLRAERQQIRDAAVKIAALPKEAVRKDMKEFTGKTAEEFRKEIGALPADEPVLRNALTADEGFRKQFQTWIANERGAVAIREQLNAPQVLASQLEAGGVPTKPDDVKASKLQQRWLLGLALLVAFVGILNAMLMSVTERFREIGTMKCLGALDSFIVKLFLIESLFQGVVGTLIGIILGLLVSLAVAGLNYGGYAFMNVQWAEIGTAVGYSAVIGVVLTVCGAIMPAWQAARMHPIEAMRVEA